MHANSSHPLLRFALAMLATVAIAAPLNAQNRGAKLPDIGSSAGRVLNPAQQSEYGAMTLAQQSHWWMWTGILSGLASFSSLVCVGIIAFIPNLLYVPWPRPYADLAWWQFALLSLPFISLGLAAQIAVMIGLRMRHPAERSAIRFYHLSIALVVLIFNSALIF